QRVPTRRAGPPQAPPPTTRNTKSPATPRHVLLSRPQKSVTKGKIERSHADKDCRWLRLREAARPRRGTGLADRLVTGPGCCQEQDGVSFVVRCAVDHGT